MRRWIAIFSVQALLAGGCGTAGDLDVQTEVRRPDVSRYRTFDWLEDDITFRPSPTGDAEDAAALERAIRETAIQTLQRKGYAAARGGPPDFYVSYHVAVFDQFKPAAKREQPLVRPAEEILERNPLPRLDEEIVRSGTLVLYVYDGSTRAYAWSGSAELAATSRIEARVKTRRAVEAILAQFPERE